MAFSEQNTDVIGLQVHMMGGYFDGYGNGFVVFDDVGYEGFIQHLDDFAGRSCVCSSVGTTKNPDFGSPCR